MNILTDFYGMNGLIHHYWKRRFLGAFLAHYSILRWNFTIKNRRNVQWTIHNTSYKKSIGLDFYHLARNFICVVNDYLISWNNVRNTHCRWTSRNFWYRIYMDWINDWTLLVFAIRKSSHKTMVSKIIPFGIFCCK